MAAKAIEKLRDLDTPELETRERELAEQVFRLRFQLTTGQAEAVDAAALGPQGFGAGQDAVAGTRIEEKLMETETAAARGSRAQERRARQELIGVVTSAKMQKTIVVKVTRPHQAPAVPARSARPQKILRA